MPFELSIPGNRAMTLGKDVIALFPDVLKTIATGDLDKKKLLYLILMRAARWLCRGIQQSGRRNKEAIGK